MKAAALAFELAQAKLAAQSADAGGLRIECNVDGCTLRFRNLSEYQRHSRVHTGVRPFKCDCCSKAFARKACLKRHRAVHLTSKPFKCQHCPKTFTFKFSRTRHEKLHAGSRARGGARRRPAGESDGVSESESAAAKSDTNGDGDGSDTMPEDAEPSPKRARVLLPRDEDAKRLLSFSNDSGCDSQSEASGQLSRSPSPGPPPPPPSSLSSQVRIVFKRERSPGQAPALQTHPSEAGGPPPAGRGRYAETLAVSGLLKLACPDCDRSFEDAGHFEKHQLLHIAIKALEQHCPSRPLLAPGTAQ